jgi:hypothetical protein
MQVQLDVEALLAEVEEVTRGGGTPQSHVKTLVTY